MHLPSHFRLVCQSKSFVLYVLTNFIWLMLTSRSRSSIQIQDWLKIYSIAITYSNLKSPRLRGYSIATFALGKHVAISSKCPDAYVPRKITCYPSIGLKWSRLGRIICSKSYSQLLPLMRGSYCGWAQSPASLILHATEVPQTEWNILLTSFYLHFLPTLSPMRASCLLM